MQLTGTNSSIDLIVLILNIHLDMHKKPASYLFLCPLLTWWLWRSGCTRSHSELGRETFQRQWYFVLRHGRVGRCQVCKAHRNKTSSQTISAKRAKQSLTDKTIFKANLKRYPIREYIKLSNTARSSPFGLQSIINRLLYGLTSSGYA